MRRQYNELSLGVTLVYNDSHFFTVTDLENILHYINFGSTFTLQMLGMGNGHMQGPLMLLVKWVLMLWER
jgi:hypothetical protein